MRPSPSLLSRLRAGSPAVLAVLLAAAAASACGRAAEGRGGADALFTRVDSLEVPAAPGSAEPNLAAGPDGRLHLSWLEPSGDSGHAFRFAVREGAGWSAPRTIATSRRMLANWADFPSLAVLGNGRLAAHWLQRRDTVKYAYDVMLVRSGDAGATWSAPVMPHRDGTSSEHGFVSLWPEGDRVAAVWLDGRKYARPARLMDRPIAKETMLAFTTIGPDGSLGAEETADARICDCCQTSAALSRSGPVVVYRDRSLEEIRDIYVVRRVNGAWTRPAPVHADGWKIDACPVNGPAIDARGDRVVVAWFTGARDTARVNVAFSGDGGATFSPPSRVDGGAPAGRVDVALAADGAAFVSWVERVAAGGGGETGAEVRVRRVAAGGESSDPVTVARSSAERASGFPRMAAVGDSLYLAWTQPGTPSRVRVTRAVLRPAAR